jgi:hypothetical protein
MGSLMAAFSFGGRFSVFIQSQYDCTIGKEAYTLSKVWVAAFSKSLDGVGAGPEQDLNNPNPGAFRTNRSGA